MKQTADILNVKVSVFPNVKDTHKTETTTVGDWLRACMDSSNPSMNLIERIRATQAETAEQTKKLRAPLKEQLPSVTMGALMHHRAAKKPDGTPYTNEEKIIALSGLLAFDIDRKENPTMNPTQLREKLSNIRNVIFCGLSASGDGVWGLIELAYPHKQKQHYEQLKKDFSLLGINLDPSKGGNPTDVRFFSYDPEAYLAESYKIYDRLPAPKPKPIRHSMHTGAYNPLQTAIRMIERATDGQKHHELLKAAHLAGGYIAAGKLTESEAIQSLENAIKSRGNIESYSNAQKTIRDGIAHGKTSPIEFRQPQEKKYNKTTSIVYYFNSIDISMYNIELDGIYTPLPDFLSLNIPKALSGDKKAQNRLQKAMEVIQKDQRLMQSEASESLSAAPIADAV